MTAIAEAAGAAGAFAQGKRLLEESLALGQELGEQRSVLFEDVFGRHIAAVGATLPPEVVTAAQACGRARDLDATVAEPLDELGG